MRKQLLTLTALAIVTLAYAAQPPPARAQTADARLDHWESEIDPRADEHNGPTAELFNTEKRPAFSVPNDYPAAVDASRPEPYSSATGPQPPARPREIFKTAPGDLAASARRDGRKNFGARRRHEALSRRHGRKNFSPPGAPSPRDEIAAFCARAPARGGGGAAAAHAGRGRDPAALSARRRRHYLFPAHPADRATEQATNFPAITVRV